MAYSRSIATIYSSYIKTFDERARYRGCNGERETEESGVSTDLVLTRLMESQRGNLHQDLDPATWHLAPESYSILELFLFTFPT